MNSLWASLLGLILIAIAVVLAFNLLQGRQTRLRDAWRRQLSGTAAAPGGGASPSPARTGSAADSALDDPPAPARAAAAQAPMRIEPTLGDAPIAAGSTADTPPAPAEPYVGTPPARLDESVLDPRLDCIVAFVPTAPLAIERLLAVGSSLRRAGSKPIAIEAHRGDGRWAVPRVAHGNAVEVRAGVLLANRHGALNAMEFAEFVQAMQALGRGIGAPVPALPEMAPVLEHARQLDEACAQLDAVIGLNVETPATLSPAELAALAAGLDLVERGNDRHARLGDDGEVLFSLALGDRAQLLTLLLDVPRAPQAARPWEQMVECAALCAERTGGRVVDDAGRPFDSAAAAGVARQLGSRYAALHEAGLDAGSTAALRVFN